MTPTKNTAKEERCSDCPSVIERRVEDGKFRERVLIKMNSYDLKIKSMGEGIVAMTGGIKDLTALMQKNFNTIYFRIGVISGTMGLITGAISALGAMQFFDR